MWPMANEFIINNAMLPEQTIAVSVSSSRNLMHWGDVSDCLIILVMCTVIVLNLKEKNGTRKKWWNKILIEFGVRWVIVVFCPLLKVIHKIVEHQSHSWLPKTVSLISRYHSKTPEWKSYWENGTIIFHKMWVLCPVNPMGSHNYYRYHIEVLTM